MSVEASGESSLLGGSDFGNDNDDIPAQISNMRTSSSNFDDPSTLPVKRPLDNSISSHPSVKKSKLSSYNDDDDDCEDVDVVDDYDDDDDDDDDDIALFVKKTAESADQSLSMLKKFMDKKLASVEKSFEECQRKRQVEEQKLHSLEGDIEECTIELEDKRKQVQKIDEVYKKLQMKIEGCVCDFVTKETLHCLMEDLVREGELQIKTKEVEIHQVMRKEEELEVLFQKIAQCTLELKTKEEELDAIKKLIDGQAKELESEREKLLNETSKKTSQHAQMKMDFESMKKQLDGQMEELELIEKQLESRKKELNLKEVEFVVQVKDVESKKKHFESLMEEVELKEKQLEGREEELELKEEKFKGKVMEIESREQEFVEQVKDLESKKMHFESRVEEHNSKEKKLEGRVEELELKEKQLEGREEELELKVKKFKGKVMEIESREQECVKQLKDLESKKMHFESRVEEHNSKEKQLEGRVEELELKEKQLKGREEELELKEKKFKGKIMEIESRELEFVEHLKDLESKKMHFESRVEEHNSKEKQLEGRVEELELKEKQLKGQVKEFESKKDEFVEQVKGVESKEKQLEGRLKELDSKEKQLEDRVEEFESQVKEVTLDERREKHNEVSVKSFQEENDLDNQSSPSIDGSSFQLLPSEKTDEPESVENHILAHLKATSDPSKVVLNIIQKHIITPCMKGDNAATIDSSHIVILEQLMRISPHVKRHEREEAMRLALDLKANMRANPENSLLVLCFLLLLSIYGLLPCFGKDEVLKLFEIVAHHKQAVELFRTLGFADKVSDFVQGLIEKQQYTEAVRFICAFKLADKNQPVDLLREYVLNAKLISERSCKNTKSLEIKDKARDQEIASLKSVRQCISDNNLESQGLLNEIQHRIIVLTMKKGTGVYFLRKRNVVRKSF